MNVSVTTVLEGYRQLENMGIIESRPQSGYYVRPRALRLPSSIMLQSKVSHSDTSIRTASIIIPKVLTRFFSQNVKKGVLTLGADLPDSDLFPYEELSIHLARIAHNYPKIANEHTSEFGHKGLMEMIVRCMIDSGCAIPIDEIVVTGGATQALMLALMAVTQTGDTVAVESPGYHGFYGILMLLRLNPVEIPSDFQTGLDVEALDSVLKQGLRPACLLLSSNFSNPTGALMPDANKEALVKLCSHYNLPIIEDDTFGELSFNGNRPRTLKALSPYNVLYIGSFSKVLAPGYRVAWLAGGRYTDDIRRCFGLSVFSIPMATQLALASFLKDGGLKRHLRQLRKKYAENVRLYQAKVAQYFPDGTQINNPKGGSFVWVELPKGHDAVILSLAAINEGISIAPGVLFSSRQCYRENFRLTCSIKWSDEIDKAIQRLGELSANSIVV